MFGITSREREREKDSNESILLSSVFFFPLLIKNQCLDQFPPLFTLNLRITAGRREETGEVVRCPWEQDQHFGSHRGTQSCICHRLLPHSRQPCQYNA